MPRFVTGLAILVILVLPDVSLARGPYGSIKVGNWNGGAFTNDASGQFTGCIASSGYQSGIVMHVMIRADGMWRLGFMHQNWSMVPGQVFPIVLTFDGKPPPMTVGGNPITDKMVDVDMPVGSALINQFRKAKTMSAFAQGQIFQFNLDGTGQLMPILGQCVAKVREGGISNAGDFNVPLIPNAAPASSPPLVQPVPAASATIPLQPSAAPVVAANPTPSPSVASDAIILPTSERRVALVIGNSGYKNVPLLPNPVNDANDIATALRRLGFNVKAINNAGFDEMRRQMIAFGRDAEDSDVALVFYAGHGMEIAGENWLIPIDAELRSDTDAEGEAIGLKSVMLQVSKASKLGLVILDACRNNPFAAKMQRSLLVRAVDRGLARTEPHDNVLVAYSSKDGTTARDGTGRNSPFTAAFLKYLPTPGLEIRFLFASVRDDVMSATKHEQQPFVYGSLSSERFYLVPPQGTVNTEPTAQPPSPTSELKQPLSPKAKPPVALVVSPNLGVIEYRNEKGC